MVKRMIDRFSTGGCVGGGGGGGGSYVGRGSCIYAERDRMEKKWGRILSGSLLR